jgi:CubicO group peptidase (beta-lactamase class C family)
MADELDGIAAATGFSGVVRADRAGQVLLERAYGFAHRGLRAAITPATRFGIASGTKGLTALAVMSLVEDGTLALGTTARSLLGDDLPLIDDAVTVEHLLAHRSGIGDYLDEEGDGELEDYMLTVAAQELAATEPFLPMLEGFPTVFPPGERFSYNNGGFMVLALIAERASGTPFHDLVRTTVIEPAGLADTDYLRSDALPGRAALGYLEVDGITVTNVFHLPVRGNGDGGIYTTAPDISTFWRALFAGRIVTPDRVAEMVKPRSDTDEESRRYGLGFWLHPTSTVVMLVGADAGVSFISAHDPATQMTATVVSNSTYGAWPVADLLHQQLGLSEK